MEKITPLALSIFIVLGTFSLKAQTFTNYTTANGMPHLNVNCLTEDAAGNMWFGTSAGIAKFDGVSNWTYYTTTSHTGLVDNTITAIAVSTNGDVWAGTDFGVSVFNGTSFTNYTVAADGLGNDRIKYIAQAANGDVWLGDFSGATKYNGSTFTAYGTTDGLPFGGIDYVDFDSNDDVYMANGLFGFIKYDGVTFTTYNTSNGLVSNNVRSIIVDASDNKWVGTAEGITVFNSTNMVLDTHASIVAITPPHVLNPVEDVKINSQGDVWAGIYVDYLGTEGGVGVNTGGSTWTDYHVADGLVGPVIRKMHIDQSDNVWIATSIGVTKISFPTLLDNTLAKEENTFSIFPNPTRNKVTIRLVKENLVVDNLLIYNTKMQLVKELPIEVNEMSKTILLNDLDKGVYLLKYGQDIEKVIIQ
jgi:ligand-binding sensor domain-containing protein